MERLEALTEKSKGLYRDDEWARVRRVGQLCEWIANHEGADIEILLAASILHAAHPRAGRTPEEAFAKRRAFAAVSELLAASAYNEEETKWILTIIEESTGALPFTVEAAILIDAVTLDGLGAVGLLTGGSPEARRIAALPSAMEDWDGELPRAEPRLHTLAAEREARRRIDFMKTFLLQLRGEISPHDTLEDLVPPATPRNDSVPEPEAAL